MSDKPEKLIITIRTKMPPVSWKPTDPSPVKATLDKVPYTRDDLVEAARREAWEAGYLEGFMASAEGWNGEYGCNDPERNRYWLEVRERAWRTTHQP